MPPPDPNDPQQQAPQQRAPQQPPQQPASGQQPLADYLQQLASGAPTPGGGAAAALTAAQAAALLSMVCNLTPAHRHPEHQQEIALLRKQCEHGQQTLANLMASDSHAFNQLMVAMRLPKTTSAERETRTQTIQQRLQDAARIPLAVMTESAALLPVAARLTAIGNRNLLSDIGIAVHLIRATFAGSQLNIQINCRSIRDPQFVRHCQTQTAALRQTLDHHAPPALAAIDTAINTTE